MKGLFTLTLIGLSLLPFSPARANVRCDVTCVNVNEVYVTKDTNRGLPEEMIEKRILWEKPLYASGHDSLSLIEDLRKECRNIGGSRIYSYYQVAPSSVLAGVYVLVDPMLDSSSSCVEQAAPGLLAPDEVRSESATLPSDLEGISPVMSPL